MLCIPKKSRLLRTAIDARKQNDNTMKDVMPFPDQDQIRLDIARVKIRSKIDFSDVYEQIRTVPEDVHKSAFATIYGTYVSHTMQIGDCNAPATFQRVMTMTCTTDPDSEMESGVAPSAPPASSVLPMLATAQDAPTSLAQPSVMSHSMSLTVVRPSTPIAQIDNPPYKDLYAQTLPYGDDTLMDDEPSS